MLVSGAAGHTFEWVKQVKQGPGPELIYNVDFDGRIQP